MTGSMHGRIEMEHRFRDPIGEMESRNEIGMELETRNEIGARAGPR
jgi:hypothetical protein